MNIQDRREMLLLKYLSVVEKMRIPDDNNFIILMCCNNGIPIYTKDKQHIYGHVVLREETDELIIFYVKLFKESSEIIRVSFRNTFRNIIRIATCELIMV